MGDLGATVGASWAVLGRRKAEKAQMPKSFKNVRKINDFGLFGPSWRTSWRPLGPSWRLLGRTWRYLGPSWAVWEAILDHLGRSWRPSWTILEAILGQRGHLGGHLEPSWRKIWELGDGMGVLRVLWGRVIPKIAGLPGGRRDGPKRQGEFFWKKNQNQNR